MGLDTSHDCWHGPYGSFNEFRLRLAQAAGLPIGPAPEGAWNAGERRMQIDWDIYPDEVYAGRWRKQDPYWVAANHADDIYGWHGAKHYDDALYLLIHSDCDGKLRRGYLPKLKARLEQIEPGYDRLAQGGYGEKSLRRFIEGLERAIGAGEHVDFH